MPEDIPKIDFQEAAATLRIPKSPLVIAIDDLAAQSVADDGYTEINRQVGAFAKKLLAAAKHESIRDHEGDPFASLVEAKHVHRGVGAALKDLGIDVSRHASFKSRVRDLALAVFVAAVGMAIEVSLEMRSISRTHEVIFMVVLLITAASTIYFIGE